MKDKDLGDAVPKPLQGLSALDPFSRETSFPAEEYIFIRRKQFPFFAEWNTPIYVDGSIFSYV